MTKDIVIYGAGGFGREVACLIRDLNALQNQSIWNLLGFIDDGIPKGTELRHGKVLGGLSYFKEFESTVSVVVAVAEPSVLQSIVQSLNEFSFVEFPNIIAPNVQFYDKSSFFMGEGNIFFYGCRFSTEVTIGDFNILNGQVAFGHDVTIGNFNSFGPSSRLSGRVTVGNLNFFGLGSSVLQNKTVANKVRLGAMSVLMRNGREGNSYFGNPATVMNL